VRWSSKLRSRKKLHLESRLRKRKKCMVHLSSKSRRKKKFRVLVVKVDKEMGSVVTQRVKL
jgi:hypothetical protein